METAENGVAWRAVTENPMGLAEDELDWPGSKRVVLAPQPVGRGAVGRIIAGVALLAVTFLIPGAAAWLGPTAVSLITGVSVSLIFGGVAELLTPTPKAPGVSDIGGAITDRGSIDQQRSALFDKSNANAAQGDVVPVLYGERLIGSLAVVSFGIELQNSL